MIEKRDFWIVTLLSIVTCGIYFWFFTYQTLKDLNRMAGEDGKVVDPALSIVLSIVTCGIYAFYLAYQQGNRLQQLGKNNGIMIEENGTSYLVWCILSYFTGFAVLIALYLWIKNFNLIADAYNTSMGNASTGYEQR